MSIIIMFYIVARDTDYRSYREIDKEYYNKASRLNTKAGISLLFI